MASKGIKDVSNAALQKRRRILLRTWPVRAGALVFGCVLLSLPGLAVAGAPNQPDFKAAALAAARRIVLVAKSGIGYRDFGRMVATTETVLRRYVASEPMRGDISDTNKEMIENAANETIGTLKASLDVWRLRYEDCDIAGPTGDEDLACNIIILNTGGQDLSGKGKSWIRKMAARAALLYARLDELPNPGGGMRTGDVLKKAFHDHKQAGIPFHVAGYKTMQAVRISDLVPSLLSWDAGSADLFIKIVTMTSK